MGLIAVGVFMVTIKNQVIIIMGVMVLMSFNELAAIYLNRLQGLINTGDEYKKVGPIGQVIRRSLNCATAITGPLFYSLYPPLPYFVAGSLTALWVVVMIIAFEKRKCFIRE